MTTTITPRTRRRRSPHQRPAVVDPMLRAVRVEVARWALATGRPLNLDAIGVILSARHAEAAIDGSPFNRWTSNSLLTFLFDSVNAWCRRNHVPVPLHLGESMLTYVDFLAEHDLLSRGSTPPHLLRSTVTELTGLTADGRRPEPDRDVISPRRAALAQPIPLGGKRRAVSGSRRS